MKFTTTLAAAALIAQTLATTSLQDGFSVIPEDKSEKKEPSKADKIRLDVMENAKSYPPIELKGSRHDGRELSRTPLKGIRGFS